MDGEQERVRLAQLGSSNLVIFEQVAAELVAIDILLP